jgi:GTP-binding protein HflX
MSHERAALVSLATRTRALRDDDAALDELAGLVRAAGGEVVLRTTQRRPTPDAATLVGRGKAEAIAVACDGAQVNLVVFDDELTPAQARNLERLVGRRVVDRTEVILDIFARRARTSEGQLQVELAQLQYLLPRLVGSGSEMSRLGGGIGTRGPGETKLETDRRRIRQRIARLKREIALVAGRRRAVRARRRRADVPTAALVGYTNAGKTTLFNLLTGDEARVSDALFVTLDPLIRRVALDGGRSCCISDTVGFIDRLPHQLVAAFRATLEEVVGADLLLLVIDAADEQWNRRVAAVRAVLEEVGAEGVPLVEVVNKIDLLTADELARLKVVRPAAVFVSAKDGTGRRALLHRIAADLALDAERVRLVLDDRLDAHRRLVAELYRQTRVVLHTTRGHRVAIEAEVPRRLRDRFQWARVSP